MDIVDMRWLHSHTIRYTSYSELFKKKNYWNIKKLKFFLLSFLNIIIFKLKCMHGNKYCFVNVVLQINEAVIL